MGALGNLSGDTGTSPRIFSKKGCKWCILIELGAKYKFTFSSLILRHFSRLRVHFLFLKNFTVCHKSAGVEGT